MNDLAQAPHDLMSWMQSLADPTRLRLLRLLERNELGVVELCDVLQLPQSTVSRHLKVLADEGLTGSRRHGTTNLYRTILDELQPPARKLWLLARELFPSSTVHFDLQGCSELSRKLTRGDADAPDPPKWSDVKQTAPYNHPVN